MARKSVFIAGDHRFEVDCPTHYQAAVSARLTHEGILRWIETDDWQKAMHKRYARDKFAKQTMTRDEYVEKAHGEHLTEIARRKVVGDYDKPKLMRWFHVKGLPAQALQQAEAYATTMQAQGYWDMIHAGYCEE